jgi:hypothetical protein
MVFVSFYPIIDFWFGKIFGQFGAKNSQNLVKLDKKMATLNKKSKNWQFLVIWLCDWFNGCENSTKL